MMFFAFLLFWRSVSSRVYQRGVFLFILVYFDNYRIRNEPVAAKLFIV
ncbi:hypothetical protein [Azospirillum argentinense]